MSSYTLSREDIEEITTELIYLLIEVRRKVGPYAFFDKPGPKDVETFNLVENTGKLLKMIEKQVGITLTKYRGKKDIFYGLFQISLSYDELYFDSIAGELEEMLNIFRSNPNFELAKIELNDQEELELVEGVKTKHYKSRLSRLEEDISLLRKSNETLNKQNREFEILRELYEAGRPLTPFLDCTHPYFAPELEAAVSAWIALFGEGKLYRRSDPDAHNSDLATTPIASIQIENWIRSNRNLVTGLATSRKSKNRQGLGRITTVIMPAKLKKKGMPAKILHDETHSAPKPKK